MPRGKRGFERKDKLGIRNLKVMNVILIVVVAALVVYVMYPAIKGAFATKPLGSTLSGINNPLTQSQLAVINGAPNSYFEKAGEAMLNLSLPNEGVSNNIYYATNFQISLNPTQQLPQFDYNGKPSAIYIGATSCLWCAESRWAMALALSRFGSFSGLYIGYSALHDADLPTLYWIEQDTNTSGSADFGNEYSSNYINFFAAEYDSNITSGFEFPSISSPVSYFVARAPNDSYLKAMQFMNATQAFSGTPFTFWGTVMNRGAAAVVFGIPQNESIAQSSGAIPLTYVTHSQMFSQLQSMNTTLAYEEYAAADVYIAEMCPSINNSAPVCSLPAIQTFEQKLGLA